MKAPDHNAEEVVASSEWKLRGDCAHFASDCRMNVGRDHADSPEQKALMGNGDDDIVLELFCSQAKFIGMALRYGLDPADAEDVVQEAFIKFIRRARSIAIHHPHAFMRKVVLHTLLEFFRRQSPVGETLDDTCGIESKGLPVELSTFLAVDFQAFAQAHPERAVALELWASGYTEREMGQALGRTPHASRQYLLECRKKIRTFLKDEP